MTTIFKVSVPFALALEDALKSAAKDQRREVTEIIQEATAGWLMDNGYLTGEARKEYEAFWGLVTDAVQVAVARVKEGLFNSAITLDTFKVCSANDEWRERAEAHIGGSIYRHGNEKKARLNREIGFRIRAAIGGVVDAHPNGKAKTVKITGEMIQSYTPLKDFDRTLV